jgi:hypothetical protein
MSTSVHDITYFIIVTVQCIVCLFFINNHLYNCSCNSICIVFFVCIVYFIVCVVLCSVFCLSVVYYFV